MACKLGIAVDSGTDASEAPCEDPEAEAAGSYVSIGTIPAPYPIDWSSPWSAMTTSFATGTATIPGLPAGDLSHSIGHVLLKVRCGSDAPFYISQTGADVASVAGISSGLWATISQAYTLYENSADMLWTTFNDGHLYDDASAAQDWTQDEARETALAGGTYLAQLDKSPTGNLNLALTGLTLSASKKAFIENAIWNLPPAPRHAFVKAKLRINDNQCAAIKSWRDEYVATGGSTRYGLARAPWMKRGDGSYDGGGCGSVSFTGAFYATGLDYQSVASRVIVRMNVGAARLTGTVQATDADATNAWFNLQSPTAHFAGTFPCRPSEGADALLHDCYGDSQEWSDGTTTNPFWLAWNGAEDTAGAATGAQLASWGGASVASSTIPAIAFEPERFYSEILTTWKDPTHDAFTMGGWCKLPGAIPSITLDARQAKGVDIPGRPTGVSGWTPGTRLP